MPYYKNVICLGCGDRNISVSTQNRITRCFCCHGRVIPLPDPFYVFGQCSKCHHLTLVLRGSSPPCKRPRCRGRYVPDDSPYHDPEVVDHIDPDSLPF